MAQNGGLFSGMAWKNPDGNAGVLSTGITISTF